MGRTFLQLIQERNFPISTLKLFGRSGSLGRHVTFQGRDIPIEPITKSSFQGLDLVFFSAGEEASLQWARTAADSGALVVDNSSAFRMQNDTPLVVPEINLSSVQTRKKTIIANPNCSTIQLVLALHPLNQAFGLKSVYVASYQAASGAGKQVLEQLKSDSLNILQEQPESEEPNDPFSLAFNCLPQIGALGEHGFSEEENKIMNETKKILSLPDLNITATAVRVPVFNAHSEAVWAGLQNPASQKEVYQALKKQKGLTLVRRKEPLPNPRFVDGWDDVYVGRVRPILGETGYMMWISADNLRKGAALNGLQIAEQLLLT